MSIVGENLSAGRFSRMTYILKHFGLSLRKWDFLSHSCQEKAWDDQFCRLSDLRKSSSQLISYRRTIPNRQGGHAKRDYSDRSIPVRWPSSAGLWVASIPEKFVRFQKEEITCLISSKPCNNIAVVGKSQQTIMQDWLKKLLTIWSWEKGMPFSLTLLILKMGRLSVCKEGVYVDDALNLSWK